MRQGLTIAFSTRRPGPQIGRYVRHLRATCGVERLEVLWRVNPGRWSLPALYNQFLDQASHQIVCLIHDDLSFARGSNWGRQLVESFAKFEEYGVFSAAGSVALEAHAVYWTPFSQMLGKVIHRVGGKTVENSYSELSESPLDALVLDGLLLAIHTRRIRTRFDERIAGFHFYDIAFSLAQSLAHQRGEGGRCGVLTGLGITHRSGGDVGPAFQAARERFQRLYGSVLPRRLRPDLRLAVPVGAQTGPSISILLLHREARVSPLALIRSLQSSAYPHFRLCLLNASGRPLEGLPPDIAFQDLPGDWPALTAAVKAQAWNTASELLLLLDTRVLPLQDWLPAMVLHFMRWGEAAGSLGVRLHYPDTHLLFQNGLTVFPHPDGRPDVAFRGINSPYGYRNALEWNRDGSPAHALMMRRRSYLALGGLGPQDWVPGLEVNLRARAAGLRNAIDSRLAGYWLGSEEDEAAAQQRYDAFLAWFAGWVSWQPKA